MRCSTWTGLGPALSPNRLLEFINRNGNILLTLSGDSPTPTAISSLLLELGIHLPPDRTSLVVDHLNYDTVSAPEKHDVLLLPQPSALRPDVRNFFGGDGLIAFPRGVAQELGNDSPHLAPILRAGGTAYSYNPKDETESVEDPFAVGEQISLVSSMQARNSARFTVLGSVEALEDTWFDAKVKALDGKQSKTANQEFARQVSAWTFMEAGVLRVGKVEHHLSSTNEKLAGNDSVIQLGYLNPKIYRVKNDVVSPCYPLIASPDIAHMMSRLSTLSSPNTHMTDCLLSPSCRPTPSNSNSACSHLSIASISNPSCTHQTAPFSAPPLKHRISMAYSPSKSTTSDRSLPM